MKTPSAFLAACLLSAAIAGAETVVYPIAGQTPEQVDSDQAACRSIASQTASPSTSQPVAGGRVQGAARGATRGAARAEQGYGYDSAFRSCMIERGYRALW